jgi:hypothetical protein
MPARRQAAAGTRARTTLTVITLNHRHHQCRGISLNISILSDA